jgi:hypothetical protein
VGSLWPDCDVLLRKPLPPLIGSALPLSEPQYVVICFARTHPHSSQMTAPNSNEKPTPLPSAHPQVHNGYQYATAHSHWAVSRSMQRDGNTFVGVPAGFEVAPGDANDLSVCGAYPWESNALVFSDNSGCGTAAAQNTSWTGSFPN